MEDIDLEWLTKTTGDPFVDVGGHVIKLLWEYENNTEKDILKTIEFVTKIYVNKWNGKLHPFFLNSTITQPSFKGNRKIEETLKFYGKIINNKSNYIEDICRFTGRKTKLFLCGRDNSILTGSQTFTNFHHAFEPGLYISKEILIRYFFVPLGVEYLGDKLAVISSNFENISYQYSANNFKKNIDRISTGISENILKSDHSYPSNALFEFSSYCIKEIKNIENASLDFYHFTNFGASPDINIYSLPASIFSFYRFCNQAKYKEYWNRFINFNYHNSKFKEYEYNQQKDKFEHKKNRAKDPISNEDFKIWKNKILEKLLNDQSILRDIRRWSIKNKFPFEIVEFYQGVIRNMEKKTIEKIKEISEFVVNDSDESKIANFIKKLDGARKGFELRRLLLKLVRDNYHEGNEQPLITLEDYVHYLFPDGAIWSEIRDLLIISIYQRLHDKKLSLDIELSDFEEKNNQGDEI